MILAHRTARRAAAIAGALSLLAVAAPAGAATGHPWQNTGGTHLCMDADNRTGLNYGATVNIWGCVADKGNQMFIPVARGKDSMKNVVFQFQVQARPSKCLDVNEAEHGVLQIWTCGPASKLNQEFALVGDGHSGDTCLLPLCNDSLALQADGTGDGSAIVAAGTSRPVFVCGNGVEDTWLENLTS